MDYLVEIYDVAGLRVASYDRVPLMDVVRTAPDQRDWIRGMLPVGATNLGHGYRIRVSLDGTVVCDAYVSQIIPQWSDTKKIILDRYVRFHEVLEFKAEQSARRGNTQVARAYTNRTISDIVKDAVNSANGNIHYLVDHNAYPDGAQREDTKFLARKTVENELEIGGISTGQWVGSNRIDATGAYAKDGDTIAGLVVDGAAWPDLRFMMIDCEETSRNSHAIKLHPEVAGWTDAQYDASGYKLQGDAAKLALQALMDTKGIDYIELNPHRNSSGEFDDRVDAYGRYIGLIYGGGECFNAAMIEQQHAEIYLYNEGSYHVPEMELKDFFSYQGANADSIESCSVVLSNFDVTSGILEVLTALAYAAGGFVWSLDRNLALKFRQSQDPDRVVFFDMEKVGVVLGSSSQSLVNIIYFDGNPVTSTLGKTYSRSNSIDEYGAKARSLDHFSFSLEEDSDKLVEGILDDLAYPEPSGEIEFVAGDATIEVGDIVEIRDGALRRLEPELTGEWGGTFTNKIIGRVKEVRHRLSGRQVSTRALLSSPLRSVTNPVGFMVRSQPSAESLYQFRLDDATVGLDMGYHLD